MKKIRKNSKKPLAIYNITVYNKEKNGTNRNAEHTKWNDMERG